MAGPLFFYISSDIWLLFLIYIRYYMILLKTTLTSLFESKWFFFDIVARCRNKALQRTWWMVDLAIWWAVHTWGVVPLIKDIVLYVVLIHYVLCCCFFCCCCCRRSSKHEWMIAKTKSDHIQWPLRMALWFLGVSANSNRFPDKGLVTFSKMKLGLGTFTCLNFEISITCCMSRWKHVSWFQ